MSDAAAVTLIVSGLITAVLLLVGGIMFIGRNVSHHYDKAACHSFAQRTGRTVKFADYTYWSWDCLTPSTDGKWISIDRLWEETPAS